MSSIRPLTPLAVRDPALQNQLRMLLRDAVESGASVGYVLPLADEVIDQYWRGVFDALEQGSLILLIAEHEGQAVATAQLSLCMKPNGIHRAEVQKVLVHTAARRRGLGRALMQAVEQAAFDAERNLLVLDTETGSAGQLLYTSMGYQVAGSIPNFVLATITTTTTIAAHSSSPMFLPTTYMYKLL